MKKFNSLKMHDANIMGYDEMKRIVGGDLPTTTTFCMTVCPDGRTLMLACTEGRCVATSKKVACKKGLSTITSIECKEEEKVS